MPSGTDVQLGALVEGYLALGGHVTLLCSESAIAPHPRLTVRRIRAPRRPFLVSEPWFIICSTLALMWHREGVVHSTGAITLCHADVSTVHFFHGSYGRRALASRATRNSLPYRLNSWAGLGLAALMERWCYRPARTRVLVGPSRGVVGELTQIMPAVRGHTRVIPNGIDRVRFAPVSKAVRGGLRRALFLAPDVLAVVFVGGDWGRKGLGKVIEALSLAHDWNLLVVGLGDQPRYETLARAHRVHERVHFLGLRQAVEQVYGACDAFVLASEYEVAPLVTYEAAASGLPLLVTKINGTEELVVNGVNGWFVQSSDDIASCLTMLSADPGLRASMSAQAVQSSAPYTWPSAVKAYADLYRELARTQRGGS